ncbi:TRAP transporter small permease subunit [Reyranella sp.]|uniref:TRAP transporter small permease subunit n=1 Tax=Reyranella sp. TaxID=1929291 RepID=UPI003BAA9BF7
MQVLLGISDAIDRVLARVAHLFGWLFVALVIVICFDVVTRKVGFQLPVFGSTPLQELEWHLHGLLFLSWLGYCYVRNVHVRIDVFTANIGPRRQAILEVVGILIFAIPYCLVASYFAFEFFEVSFMQGETSDAPNGLPFRWIMKGALFLGLVLLDFAVASVLMRKLVQLFGPPDLAERAVQPVTSH